MSLVNSEDKQEVFDFKIVQIWCQNQRKVKEDLIGDLEYHLSIVQENNHKLLDNVITYEDIVFVQSQDNAQFAVILVFKKLNIESKGDKSARSARSVIKKKNAK